MSLGKLAYSANLRYIEGSDSTMSSPEILKRRRVLGIPFYTHLRLEERELDLPVPEGELAYPGLLVLGRYWDGLVKDQEIPRKQDWVHLVIESVSYSLLSLIWKGQVRVKAHHDRRRMIFGLLRSRTDSYSLHLGEAFHGGDLLGKRLYGLIGGLEKLPKHKNWMSALGPLLFKSFFGGQTMEEPARKLLEEILMLYSKGYPWVRVESKRTAMLKSKVIQFQLAKGKGEELAEEYQLARSWVEEYNDSDVDFIQFMRAVSSSMTAEISMRVRSTSTTNP